MVRKEWAARLPAVKSKADLVYDNLREGIVSGALRPGDRINMDELARTLGVSKIPIREAVKRLEADGLLDSRVHSGVVVAQVDQTEMRGVFLARGAIEGLVGRLAAEQVSDALLRDLEETQKRMRASLRTGDTGRLAELNSEFHRRLAEASGYRILADLTEQLLLTVRRYRIVEPAGEQNWESVIAEHDAIVEALRAGDSSAAAEAAEAHIISQAGHEVSRG
ncbi:GntR family transcriptional regulator [Amycolatopsis sp. La24]|uniref:GntR family transcriptional regulator n=1 Tax=Amycolatopsis sp. La24 TaxID=3028304 RepID=UPI0023B07A4C|nr:GntR family transcriptional regulator [Amycolatopsis sp. La24]